MAGGLACAAVCWPPGAAMADEQLYYGAVVCKGNEALVRFADAGDEDTPDFSGTPGSAPAALKQLKPADPSRCTLADGREVRLRHIGLRDFAPHGECGGDESQIFSLWIAGRKIYSEEIFHNKCGFPYDIASVLLRRQASDRMPNRDEVHLRRRPQARLPRRFRAPESADRRKRSPGRVRPHPLRSRQGGFLPRPCEGRTGGALVGAALAGARLLALGDGCRRGRCR